MKKILSILFLCSASLLMIFGQDFRPGKSSGGGAPSGSAGGDLAGSYPNPTVTGPTHLSGTAASLSIGGNAATATVAINLAGSYATTGPYTAVGDQLTGSYSYHLSNPTNSLVSDFAPYSFGGSIAQKGTNSSMFEFWLGDSTQNPNMLQTPTNGSFSTASSGGILSNGTYYYRIAGYCSTCSASGGSGVSWASAETSKVVNAGGSANTVTVTATGFTNATGCYVYGRTTGAEQLIAAGTLSTGTCTYTDTGSISPSGALPSQNGTAPYPILSARNNIGYDGNGQILQIRNHSDTGFIGAMYTTQSNPVFNLTCDSLPCTGENANQLLSVQNDSGGGVSLRVMHSTTPTDQLIATDGQVEVKTVLKLDNPITGGAYTPVFWYPLGYPGYTGSQTQHIGLSSPANSVRYLSISVQSPQTFGHIYVNIATGDSGKYVSLGIYSSSSGVPVTLLCQTTPVLITSTGIKQLAFTSPCMVGPASVYIASTEDGTAGTADAYNFGIPLETFSGLTFHETTNTAGCISTGSGTSIVFPGTLTGCSFTQSGAGDAPIMYALGQ